MYTGYSEEQLMNIIDFKKATLLRDELKRKGEVLPATKDVVFKNVMMNSKIFLSIILEYFLGIDKKIIIEICDLKIQNYLLVMLKNKGKLLI